MSFFKAFGNSVQHSFLLMKDIVHWTLPKFRRQTNKKKFTLEEFGCQRHLVTRKKN